MRFLKSTHTDSTNRKIFRAAVIVGLSTVVAKVGATFKELIVARTFGRGDALDAFLIAVLLPTFVLGLAATALESALIPSFIKTRQKEGPEGAQRLFSSVLLLSLLLLTTAGALLGLLAPYYLPYLGSGFSAAKLQLTRELLYALLPFIVFNGVTGCASAVLNAGENFVLPALTPLVTPLVTIFFIQMLAPIWGAFTLAMGTVVGSFIEASLLARALRAHGLRLSPRWSGLDPGLRSVLKQYAPMLAGGFLMSGTTVVDQSMAAMLPTGSVAALNYGNKIVGVILTVGATGLGTATFPYLSKMIAENDWTGCRNTLKKYSLLVVSTTVPLALALMILSGPLVRLLFQRGAFSAADARLVSWVQICYAVQIPFNIWNRLFVRFLSAMRHNQVLMYICAISLILDVIFNLILMKVWGVAGIALSTSLVYIFGFILLSTWSVKLLRQQELKLTPAPTQPGVR